MSDLTIAGIGAYTPRLRINADEFTEALGQFEAAGIEQKAVPEADEDTLTMAYEAASRALDVTGHTGDEVAHLAFASTTPPMEEEDLTARLTSMLGAPADATTRTTTGSTRAGAQTLDAALDAGPWGDRVAIVVASDAPRGSPDSGIEHAGGAGAVALVLSEDGPVRVTDRASYVASYPGTRFREAGDAETDSLGIANYDRQAFTTAVGGAADGLETDVTDVDAAAIQSSDGKLPYRAAGVLGVDMDTIAAAETVSELGDTGTASPLFGCVRAFESGANQVLVVAYGSGVAANAFVLSADGDVPVAALLEGDTQLTYPEYLRRRGEITTGEPEGGGAYVSVPTWQQTTPQRHRLVAGRCPACGALNFPPGGACQNCGERPEEYERVELLGTGTVEAATTIAQGGAPPEFVEQQARSGPFVSAIVAFDGPDGDETVSAPVQVVAGEDESVTIGSAVEATIRRIYQQEGVIRYGFKTELAGTRQ